jgi:hypothetical protein
MAEHGEAEHGTPPKVEEKKVSFPRWPSYLERWKTIVFALLLAGGVVDLIYSAKNASGSGRSAGVTREADALRIARLQAEVAKAKAQAEAVSNSTPAPKRDTTVTLTLAGQREVRLIVGDGENGWTPWVRHQGQSDFTTARYPRVPMEHEGPIDDGDGFQKYRFRPKDRSGLKAVVFTITEPR